MSLETGVFLATAACHRELCEQHTLGSCHTELFQNSSNLATLAPDHSGPVSMLSTSLSSRVSDQPPQHLDTHLTLNAP